MDIEAIRDFALSLPDTQESCPFGPETLVFKSVGKMFLLLPLDEEELLFNVKCDPEMALDLREQYPDHIRAGYHMNKKHWNTVRADGYLPDALVLDFIRQSHQLVQPKSTRKKSS